VGERNGICLKEKGMSFRYDVRLSGSGGQGLILMGLILAEAIGIYEGKFVALTQSYGPEARGGVSKAELVVSDEEIDYPKAMALDLLVCLNQRSCDEYYSDLKPDGIMIADSTLVDQIPLPGAFQIPFTRIAREQLKREMAANIVALGAISKLTDFVRPKSLEKALLARIPKGTEELNLKALKIGLTAGTKYRRSKRTTIVREREDEDT
jgi:2-oxoglutarate ferredoxin oxidoreductase subunit gamma